MSSTDLTKAAERFAAGAVHQPNPKVRSPKLIRDALWGDIVLAPHEVALLDTPLIQRLRAVHQTGLAYLVYPSAAHSRFEHSVGATHVVSRLVQRLSERHAHLPDMGDSVDVMRRETANLRLAALVHDCGHGLFSHVSESIYAQLPEMQSILTEESFAHLKPSELLTYLIVKSDAFVQLVEEIASTYDVPLDAAKIADFILGHGKPSELFLASLINGPVDADKIDYLYRDSYFTGVASTFDVDRLFSQLAVVTFPDGTRVQALQTSLPLERLLFAKVSLYASVYQHQKVLAADCLVKGLFEFVQDEGISLFGLTFRDPFDFLRVTDYRLLDLYGAERHDYAGRVITRLAGRELPVRCLTLCRQTIENYDVTAYLLQRLAEAPSEVREIRRKICSALPAGNCSEHDVWLSVPSSPSLREASQTPLLLGGEAVGADSMYPLEGWLRAYSDNKWRGYVFGPWQLQSEIATAATKVLHDELDLQLNRLSTDLSHVNL